MLFVVLSNALTEGYRRWIDEQVRLDHAGKPTTLGAFTRQLAAENHDRLIVFVGEHYGIYSTREAFMLLGRRVKNPNPKGAPDPSTLLDRLRGTAMKA